MTGIFGSTPADHAISSDRKVAGVLTPIVEDEQPYGTPQPDSLAAGLEFQGPFDMSQRLILAGILEHSDFRAGPDCRSG